MTEKTLGQELIGAIEDALTSKEAGRIVHPDVAALRKKLNLTQKEFSVTYHIKIETLRNWEQNKRSPNTTSLAYLACIAKKPNLIKKLLKPD